MSGAQVSQVKKSECGITQPGSCITGNNVLNKGGARVPEPLPEASILTNKRP